MRIVPPAYLYVGDSLWKTGSGDLVQPASRQAWTQADVCSVLQSHEES